MSNEMKDQDVAVVRGHLADAQASIAKATELLPPLPEVPRPPVIDTPDAFDRALDTVAAFGILTLPVTFRYPRPLVLRKPVTIVSETFDARRGMRMTVDEPAPSFLGGVDLLGDDIYWLGIEARQINEQGSVVQMRGARQLLDRPRILGDPTKGGRRGVLYSGDAGAVLRPYINDIFLAGRDTQAIYSQDMGPGGFVIDDGFLCAAGESIMFGGGDPTSQARIPRGIRITRSVLTKKREWLDIVSGSFATGNAKHRWQCKTPFELKNANDVSMDGCLLEYGGTSEGQPSATMVFTPRNQGNTAPYTTVSNVRISNCLGRFAGGGAHFLGDDNNHPSQQLSDVSLWNCQFEDLEPAKWGGVGRVFFLNRGTINVHLEAITASGVGLKSIIYCDERKPPVGLVARNFRMPANLRYPYHNVNGDTLASLQAYAPDAVLEIRPGDVGAVLPVGVV